MSNQQVGHGASISFGSSGFQAYVNFQSIKIGKSSRAVVPTTHLGTSSPTSTQQGNATSIPGKVIEQGPLMCSVQFDPAASKWPPLNGAVETVTLTFPNGEVWSGSGYVSEVGDVSLESDDLVVVDITVTRTAPWSMA